jgi:hypothetical protein
VGGEEHVSIASLHIPEGLLEKPSEISSGSDKMNATANSCFLLRPLHPLPQRPQLRKDAYAEVAQDVVDTHPGTWRGQGRRTQWQRGGRWSSAGGDVNAKGDEIWRAVSS